MLALLLLSVGGLLSACVAYEVPGRDGRTYYGDRDRYYSDRDRDGVRDRIDRDRDGDGVPNRQDSRPDDPRRY
jgi:hypothetical protein